MSRHAIVEYNLMHLFHFIFKIYPNTRIHVITPSNEFHVQATNLSVCSTLLAASSVSNPQLWAEVANACPTYFHSQPDDPFLNTITLLHVPCHCIRDVIQLNQCLPLLFLHQFTQTIFVSSWDVFHVSKQDHQHAIELASSLFLSSLQLAIPNSNVKELEASFQKCPPLTVLYHQPTFPPDSLQKFDVLEIFKHGSHGVIFSNRFLDTLGLHSCPLPSPITFSPPRDYDRIIR
ncbi:hypothetical protein HMI54_005490 [Coelomomyces lativittatus]|nr:hypothetical protein HMI54_005490 [Coelomomyces lativittatus]